MMVLQLPISTVRSWVTSLISVLRTRVFLLLILVLQSQLVFFPAKNRIYVISKFEADVNPNVNTGIFLINDVPAYVLFDIGSTVSSVATSFIKKVGITNRSHVRSLTLFLLGRISVSQN